MLVAMLSPTDPDRVKPLQSEEKNIDLKYKCLTPSNRHHLFPPLLSRHLLYTRCHRPLDLTRLLQLALLSHVDQHNTASPHSILGLAWLWLLLFQVSVSLSSLTFELPRIV